MGLTLDPITPIVDSALLRTTTQYHNGLDQSSEDALRYLCLVYQEEVSPGALPTKECSAFSAEMSAYREVLQESGHFLAAGSLQGEHAATTVRVETGTVSVADGPLGERKERLHGFYLIEATDLNDAIRVARRMSPARRGVIEIWPVLDPDAQGCRGR